MKRSEMLHKLAITFLENQGGTTPIKFAELMLKTCEEAGMRPPNYVASVQEKGGPLDGVWVQQSFEDWEKE